MALLGPDLPNCVRRCARVRCVMWMFLALLGGMVGQARHCFIQVSTKTFRSHLALPAAVAVPGRVLRKPEPRLVSHLLWLPCLALLGTVTHRRGVPCFARERLRGSAPSRNRQGRAKSKGDDLRILTSKIKKAETSADLLNVLDGAVDSSIFDHIHASAASTSLAVFHAQGKLQAVDAESPTIQRLASRIEVLIKANEVGPRELANVLWAFAKVFVAVRAVLVIMPALVGAVTAKSKGMKAQELANSLWAAAQLQDACPEVLEMLPALVARIPGKAGDMKPQELSNIILATAKLQDVAPVVREALPATTAEIPGNAGAMNPQDLANNLWAAAKLQDAAPGVLEIVPALVEEIPAKVGGMIPQGLSNVLWAAALLHAKDAAVLKVVAAVVKQITQQPGAMNPQDLANNLWAAGQLQDAAPEVLQVVPAVVPQIPAKAAEMIPQHLSNSLFAAMRLAHAVPEVLEAVPALVKELPGKIGSMKAQELANSLEALVVLEERLPIVELPGIATATAAQLKRTLPQLKGKDLPFAIPMIVWACATKRVRDAELLGAVAKRFVSNRMIDSLPGWNLCALTWAYRNLDEEGVYRDLVGRLESEISKRGLREEEILAERG